MSRFACFSLLLVLVACGDDDRRPTRDGGVLPDVSLPDTSMVGCTPGAPACAGNIHYTCAPDGMGRLNEMVCEAACNPAAGCVACTPGTRVCSGDTSMVCNRAGTGTVAARNCSETGTTCGANGYCNDACGAAESSKSNIGCEYWPTPLSNSGGYEGRYDFRVVVANPNGTPVNVTVYRGTTSVGTANVPAGELRDIILPWVAGQSEPDVTETWNSMIVANGAYRLVSDLPVTVAQFNPFEYDNGRMVPDPADIFGFDMIPDYSYTNDASLLLPAHSFTGDYIVSSFTPLSRYVDQGFGAQAGKSPGYISIVGITPEPTTVSVNVTAPSAADAAGRFPAASPGTTINFTLQRGEVATIFAAVPPNCAPGRPGHVSESPQAGVTVGYCNETEYDLTGSRVVADNPVGVFGAHLCAYVPYNAQACDHLENQMPPLQTWGTTYVSAPMGDLGDSTTVNIVRVMAAFDGTSVTVTPAQDGVSSFTLGVGEWQEFRATSGFQVSGSQGILVSQFLVGQNEGSTPADRGDPAMVVLPPEQQFRSDYTFVTPTSYNPGTLGQSYLLVVRDPEQAIFLNGAAVNGEWNTVGGKQWALVPVAGGTNSMESGAPFGVIVYGLGQYTSYAYPAGLNLEEILLI